MWLVRLWDDESYSWKEVARFEDFDQAIEYATTTLKGQGATLIKEHK